MGWNIDCTTRHCRLSEFTKDKLTSPLSSKMKMWIEEFFSSPRKPDLCPEESSFDAITGKQLQDQTNCDKSDACCNAVKAFPWLAWDSTHQSQWQEITVGAVPIFTTGQIYRTFIIFIALCWIYLMLLLYMNIIQTTSPIQETGQFDDGPVYSLAALGTRRFDLPVNIERLRRSCQSGRHSDNPRRRICHDPPPPSGTGALTLNKRMWTEEIGKTTPLETQAGACGGTNDEEPRSLRRQRYCGVCQRTTHDILLSPCKHMYYCKICSSIIKVCPVCKKSTRK